VHGGGAWVLEFLEDAQSVLTGVACRVCVAERLVDLGEVGKDVCFVVPIAELSGHGDRPLVAGDRFAMCADAVVCDAEAVPGGGLAALVAGLAVQGECLLAVCDGLLWVAEFEVAPTYCVARPGLSCGVR
jgi:hypothetical protein